MITIDPPVKAEPVRSNLKKAISNSVSYWGYLLLAVSLLLYTIEEAANIQQLNDDLTVFFIHYGLAVAYTVILLFNKALGIVKSWSRDHIHKTVILLNLFLLSAYALNRELPVFEQSATWLCVHLILSSLVILSFNYFSRLPEGINKLQYICLGSALVLYIYLSVYCANFYIFGGIGIIVFGIGGHILVPLFLVIASFALINHSRSEKRISFLWILLGVTITISTVAIFVGHWNTRIKAIEKIANQSVLYPDTGLPTWVKIAQTVKNDWLTERMLKSHLVYTIANDHFQWDSFPGRARWNEQRIHDPLVFIASLTRKLSLSQEERIKVLQAITGNRHKAEERLWSGDNLVTSYIVNDADIYPDLRLAYTEKYFNVRNDLRTNRTWGTTQEAIYTFQLPEGSVITSLSLWVNGKEEKGILTSKQKAKEAYTTIVGTERRDPSVVHWQEGNTVSVSVFPCTPTEERKFKIGITSPLAEENGRILYKGISFRGPSAYGATETFRIRFMGNPADLILPTSFAKNEKGEYVCEQDHDPDFEMSFKSVPLKANQFNFNGFRYSLSDLKPTFRSADFSTLYLDINKSWSKDELDALRPVLKNHRVYAHADDQFVPLNDDNWSALTSALLQRNFSIFPFHYLNDPDKSLIISKGQELSPYLNDFSDSKFAKEVSNFFAAKKKVYVYNISSSTSTYIRSLRELRALDFASGSLGQLISFLQKAEFPVTLEHDQQIVIHDAKMKITKEPASHPGGSNNAPDHLARLFAYNNIMRQVGPHFFSKDFINEKLVDEATTAYVVSPVSSLIVLETQEDYERFGIQDKNNSLHNASKLSSGAVPEPHEWALIILFALIVLFCLGKQRSKKAIL